MDLQWIIFWVLFGVFIIASGFVTGIIFYRRYWRMKFVVLQNLGSGTTITMSGRCRLVPIGDGGEEIFYLRNIKKYRVAYGKRIGKNQVAWAVGQDGYWYNVNFGDLDSKLQQMGLNPVDRDMRYAYASTRKLLNSKFERKSFMDKYGVLISFMMLFMCIAALGITVWMVFHYQAQSQAISLEITKANKDNIDASSKLITQLANLKLGNSGLATGGAT
jgi:hypothetical protein